MSALSLFQFGSRKIRVIIDENGEPLFVGKDVCEALGYTNPNKAMGDHCRGVTKRYPIADSLGRTQLVRVLTEGDTFRLIVGSALPAAQDFERLLFEEILPSIRRTGAYVHPASSDNARSQLAMAQEIGLLKNQLAHRDQVIAAKDQAIMGLQGELIGSLRGQNRLLGRVSRMEKRHAAHEAKELVILLEAQGVPRDEIAARSGKNSNHIRQIIHQARLAGRLPRQGELNLA